MCLTSGTSPEDSEVLVEDKVMDLHAVTASVGGRHSALSLLSGS